MEVYQLVKKTADEESFVFASTPLGYPFALCL
jgi:hypothetical protein